MKTETDYIYWYERWGGWGIIILASFIPVVRWFMLEGFSDRFSTVQSTLVAFGQVTGIIGFILYAINMVLSIRMRWLESLFGGLNRVYIAHHITGGLAFICILFHPLFLAIRYIELSTLSTLKDAGEFLLPKSLRFDGSYYELQEAVAINNGIISFVLTVALLILTFFIKLPYRIWLYTHKFLGIAFVFGGLHTIMVSSDVYGDAFLKVYMALWLILGVIAYLYRTILGNLFVRRAPYKVESVDTMSGGVIHINLIPMKKPIDFLAGQFVFIRFLWSNDKGVSNEAHPFSIASSPNEPSGQLRLFVKSLGDYTSTLKNIQKGTIAEVEGAFGKFIPQRYSMNPQIWIAGGIGITPFLSAARSFSKDSPPVAMFYSVQTRSELIDQEVLTEYLPKYYSQFSYFPYVNEEQDGFLNAQYINEHAKLINADIFLCGPPPMMKAMRSQLRALGVPNSRIHSEEFSMQ